MRHEQHRFKCRLTAGLRGSHKSANFRPLEPLVVTYTSQAVRSRLEVPTVGARQQSGDLEHFDNLKLALLRAGIGAVCRRDSRVALDGNRESLLAWTFGRVIPDDESKCGSGQLSPYAAGAPISRRHPCTPSVRDGAGYDASIPHRP